MKKLELPKKLTAKWLQENLSENYKGTKEKNVFRYRSSFFYRHGCDEDKVAERVIEEFKKLLGLDIEVLDKFEHWAPWPRDSYWEVRFKVPA